MRSGTRRRLPAVAATAAMALVMLAGAPASHGATTQYRGAFRCSDGQPLAGARVELWQQHVRWLPKIPPNITLRNVSRANDDGAWGFTISGDESNWYLRVVLVGQDAAVRDWPWPWNWFAETLRSQNDRPVRDYGTQLVSAYQCAVFNGFSAAGREYREQVGSAPPQGVTTVLAGAPTAGTPFTAYDTVWWPSGYPVLKRDGTSVARHEFAHAFRHRFDGPGGHFAFDAARFWYLRHHSAESCAPTNEGFAFNEGWAEFWAGNVSSPCSGTASGRIERNVAAGLKRLQDACRLPRARMVQVLADHPRGIHSLADYTRALHCTPPVKRLGKARVRKPIGALADDRRLLLRAARRLVSAISASMDRLRRDAAAAARSARRARCPRRPCETELALTVRAAQLRGEVAQARALRRLYTSVADQAAMRRLAAGSLARQLQRLETRRRATIADAARIAAQTLERMRRTARRLGADRESLDLLHRAQRAAGRGSPDVLAGMAPVPPAGLPVVGPTPSAPRRPTSPRRPSPRRRPRGPAPTS